MYKTFAKNRDFFFFLLLVKSFNRILMWAKLSVTNKRERQVKTCTFTGNSVENHHYTLDIFLFYEYSFHQVMNTNIFIPLVHRKDSTSN